MSHLVWTLIAIATGIAGYFIGENQNTPNNEIYEITGQTTLLDVANAKNKGQKVTLLGKDWDSLTKASKNKKITFPKGGSTQLGKDVEDSQNPFENGTLTRHYPATDKELAEEARDY